MKWSMFAEKELDFYKHHQQYISEIKDHIKEQEKDIRGYPSILAD